MKKVFLPLAVSALLTVAGCTKEGNYEKTQLTFSTTFSENYLSLYDVTVEGRNFDGSDLTMPIASGDNTCVFESDATEGETCVRIFSRLRNPLPDIDTAATYDLTYSVKGNIRAKVKDGEAYMSFESFDFTDGKKSSKITGKQLLADTTGYLACRTFDRAFQYSISRHWKSIIVGAEEIP